MSRHQRGGEGARMSKHLRENNHTQHTGATAIFRERQNSQKVWEFLRYSFYPNEKDNRQGRDTVIMRSFPTRAYKQTSLWIERREMSLFYFLKEEKNSTENIAVTTV